MWSTYYDIKISSTLQWILTFYLQLLHNSHVGDSHMLFMPIYCRYLLNKCAYDKKMWIICRKKCWNFSSHVDNWNVLVSYCSLCHFRELFLNCFFFHCLLTNCFRLRIIIWTDFSWFIEWIEFYICSPNSFFILNVESIAV